MTAVRAPIAISKINERVDELISQTNKIIVDKDREVRLTIACLIAGGHLLIEDIPGVGKTTLVKTLAQLTGLKASRIQFTNDLLPADIVGSSIFDNEQKKFIFHPGPIFAQLVLADELNRATPKTQSACLQAMEERKITVDGVTHQLPLPFFLIATQNPRQQIGTFALPESQLDRFLMRISIGYPSRTAERELLTGVDRTESLERLSSVLSLQDLDDLRVASHEVHLSENVVNYIQDLVAKTRDRKAVGLGLSPRGARGLVQAAQAWALMHRRKMVLPEDVQAVAVAVLCHRLNPTDDPTGETGLRLAQDVLASVSVD